MDPPSGFEDGGVPALVLSQGPSTHPAVRFQISTVTAAISLETYGFQEVKVHDMWRGLFIVSYGSGSLNAFT